MAPGHWTVEPLDWRPWKRFQPISPITCFWSRKRVVRYAHDLEETVGVGRWQLDKVIRDYDLAPAQIDGTESGS